MIPPFVPQIRGVDDTQYFDEEESISEMSESFESSPDPTPDEISTALNGFSSGMQTMATQLIKSPFDSVKLRNIDAGIDSSPNLGRMEKEVLKQFVRLYGKKERKRPRDKLLRDPKTKHAVLHVRKQTAFLGYTWRRRRPHPYVYAGAGFSVGSGYRIQKSVSAVADAGSYRWAFRGRSRSYL
jgi:protein-serine/threonine kinase